MRPRDCWAGMKGRGDSDGYNTLHSLHFARLLIDSSDRMTKMNQGHWDKGKVTGKNRGCWSEQSE